MGANSNSNCNGGSSFRIKRPRITTNGFVSEADPTIKKHLDELNELLGKRVFKVHLDHGQRVATATGQKVKKAPASANQDIEGIRSTPDVEEVLRAELTPKRIPHRKTPDQ